MAIKNYTTKIAVEKTVSEIEVILSKHGAKKILKDYDGGGHVCGISFMVETPAGGIPFKLPIDLKAWVSLVNRAVDERKLPQRFLHDADQARRVGWRVIKDWIDAQLAIVETQTVTIEQVFLPYAYDLRTDETMYEKFLSKREEFVALEEPSKEFKQSGVGLNKQAKAVK